MIKTITQIDYLEDVALVTVNNIPNLTKNVSFILNEIASRGVTVDMICQTAAYKDKLNLFSPFLRIVLLMLLPQQLLSVLSLLIFQRI